MGTLILLPACNNATYTESISYTNSSSPQLSIIPATTETEPQGLQLSDALKSNCEPNQEETRNSFRNVGLEVGTIAVDFTLSDTNGNEITLSELLSVKPVAMVFGSFTWPPFRRSCAANNELYAKYGDDINFIIVYIIEPHPVGSESPYSNKEWPLAYSEDKDGNPITQPLTYEERLAMAQKTIVEQGINVTMLVDEIDNPVWCTYGQAPNIAYLIGIDGTIIAKQDWYNPDKMEELILACIING